MKYYGLTDENRKLALKPKVSWQLLLEECRCKVYENIFKAGLKRVRIVSIRVRNFEFNVQLCVLILIFRVNLNE
jgi:uncharacterized cysteine cluster protein YcgN (CxxCxxCC family)